MSEISFWKLLNENSVEIPIIQRDYVQGSNVYINTVGQKFLDTLKEHIANDKPISLDFVYGCSNDKNFQPLDGQQRLTTLFLLHWYAIQKDTWQKDNDEVDNSLKKILNKFTYKIRISSRTFIEKLIAKDFCFDFEGSATISATIKDSNWYLTSWKHDTTIVSMLNMLDAIHKTFSNTDNLFEKLTKYELIKFLQKDLDNFALSDDLYIKMNARGRALTTFENLKAEIERKINENNWETGFDINDKFSTKIDGEWTDLMWKEFRNENNNDIDNPHIKLLSFIVLFSYTIRNQDSKNKNLDEIVKKFNDESIGLNMIDYIDKSVYEDIMKYYNIFSQNIHCVSQFEINNNIINMGKYSTNIKDIINGTPSYSQKILFFAILKFMEKSKGSFDEKKYHNWMRVVRNIVCQIKESLSGTTDLISEPKPFISTLNLVNSLSRGCDDIYNFIQNFNPKSSQKRIAEEKLKAEIINTLPQYENLIYELENHDMFLGRLSFPLSCARYKNNDINTINFTALSDLKDILDTQFTKYNVVSDNFIRAMLTIEINGEYRFYDYGDNIWTVENQVLERKQLLPKTDDVDYCLSDKYLNQYGIYFSELMIKLLDLKNHNQQATIENYLDSFIHAHTTPPQNMPEWQYKLICDKKWLEKFKEEEFSRNRKKFIAIENDICYILKSPRPQTKNDTIKID